MPPIVGAKFLRFDALESTNDTAKELLGTEAGEGSIIVAERQVAGKGRHGKTWFSPPGGLYCSIVLKPEKRHVQMLTLLSGIPVIKALRHWSVLAALKWPNDVVVQGRKIGGILCEGVHKGEEFYVVAGIGVNTNVVLDRLPEEVRLASTSVLSQTGAEVSNEEVLEYMLREYDKVYKGFQGKARNVLAREYMAFCTTIRQKVEVATHDGTIRGMAVEVNPMGSLVVVDEAGRRVEVPDGTVTHL